MRVGYCQVGLKLAVALLSCCAVPRPAAPSAPPAPDGAETAPLPAFTPPAANPERKAKLVALAPRIDELFQARVAETGVTGAAVAILLEGEPVYLKTFGVRDIVSKTPVDAETVFRIGSVSKTITALAVLKLRDQGKVMLDAPAAKYVAALRTIGGPTRDSPPPSVRHLLTMTSGLGYDDIWGAVTFGYSAPELGALIARGFSFAGAPGERYRYSNLGFALLGKIVEHTSGKPFSAYVKSEIFGPLGMRSSGFVSDGAPLERMAVGYYRDGDRLVQEPVPDDGVFAPAGGAYTTLNDLARYAAFQLAAYPPRDDAETGPVRRSTLREMHAGQAWARWAEDEPVLKRTPEGKPSLTAMSYGLGWAQNTTCQFEAMVQHGGYEPGYYAVIRLLPRQRLGVVTLSTTDSLGRLRTFELLAELLRDAGVSEPPLPPPSPALVTARAAVLQLLARWDPEIVARQFDPLSQQYSFFRNFRRDMERMGREHGRCQPDGEIVALSRTHGRFRLTCERGAIWFLAFLTPRATPTIQMVEWQEELPVTEKEQAVASAVMAALTTGAPLAAELVGPSVDRAQLERRLSRLRGTYGDRCELERPLWSRGNGQASFRLRCAVSPLDLTIHIDPATSRLLDLSSTEPRAFGAVCAE